jgi:hypothetical protein
MSTIEFAIKMKEGSPVGHPLLASNVAQIFGLSEVTMESLLQIEYSPFTPSTMPKDNLRQKTIHDGYVLDAAGYVRDSYSTEKKTFDELNKDEILEEKLKVLSDGLHSQLSRPIVPTTLGFSVDGGIGDLISLEIGRKHERLSIKDSYNSVHVIGIEDYDIIISSIEDKRLSILDTKWGLEQKIKNVDLNTAAGLVELDNIDVNFMSTDVHMERRNTSMDS